MSKSPHTIPAHQPLHRIIIWHQPIHLHQEFLIIPRMSTFRWPIAIAIRNPSIFSGLPECIWRLWIMSPNMLFMFLPSFFFRVPEKKNNATPWRRPQTSNFEVSSPSNLRISQPYPLEPKKSNRTVVCMEFLSFRDENRGLPEKYPAGN